MKVSYSALWYLQVEKLVDVVGDERAGLLDASRQHQQRRHQLGTVKKKQLRTVNI